MSKEIKAGGLFVEIFAKDGKFQTTLNKTSQRLEKFQKQANAIAIKLAATSGAATGSILLMAKSFADAGDRLSKLSTTTGASVEWLSKMDHAAKVTGGSLEGVTGILKDLDKNLHDALTGNDAMADSFRDLGVNLQQLKAASPEKRFELIAQAISKIEDPAQRLTVANKLLGGSSQEMMGMLVGGSTGVRNALQDAANAGATMSTEQAQAATALKEEWTKLTAQAGLLTREIGATFAPALTDLLKKTKEYLPLILDWIKSNKDTIVTAGKVSAGVLAVGTGIGALGTAASVASGAVRQLSAATLLLGKNLRLLALGGIATALAAVAIAWARSTKAVKDFNSELERSNKLTGKIIAGQDRRNEASFKEANSAKNPLDRRKALEDELSRLKKEQSGNENSLNSAKNNLTSTKTTWNATAHTLVGAGKIAEAQSAVSDAEKFLDSTSDAVRNVENALADIDNELAAAIEDNIGGKAFREAIEAAKKKQQEAEQEAKRQAESLKSEVESIIEKTRTPLERLHATTERLRELYESGQIDEEVFSRAQNLAMTEAGMKSTQGPAENVQNASAAQQGSTEAFSAMVAAMNDRQNYEAKTAKNTATIAKEIVKQKPQTIYVAGI